MNRFGDYDKLRYYYRVCIDVFHTRNCFDFRSKDTNTTNADKTADQLIHRQLFLWICDPNGGRLWSPFPLQHKSVQGISVDRAKPASRSAKIRSICLDVPCLDCIYISMSIYIALEIWFVIYRSDWFVTDSQFFGLYIRSNFINITYSPAF